MPQATHKELEDSTDDTTDDTMINLGRQFEGRQSSTRPLRSSSCFERPSTSFHRRPRDDQLGSHSDHGVSAMALNKNRGNEQLHSDETAAEMEISVGGNKLSSTAHPNSPTRKLDPNVVRRWNRGSLLGLPPAFRSSAHILQFQRNLSIQDVVFREPLKPLFLDSSHSATTYTTAKSTHADIGVEAGGSVNDMPSSTGKLDKEILSVWNEASSDGLPPAFRASLNQASRPRPPSPPMVPTVLQETPREKGNASLHNQGIVLAPPAKLQRMWPPKKKTKSKARNRAEKIARQAVKKQVESLEHQSGQVTTDQAVEPISGDDGKYLLHNDEGDTDSKATSSFPPKSALKDEFGAQEQEDDSSVGRGTLKRKASLRVRWKGTEIFFIESRHDSYYDDLNDADDADDVVDDRFNSLAEALAPGVDTTGGPLLPDRFTSRNGDSAPSCPNRARRDSFSSEESYDDTSSSNEDSTSAGDMIPARPTIWVTVYDDSDPSNGIQWRVKRVWGVDALDANEGEQIVSEPELIDTVKILAGVYGLDTASRERQKEEYDGSKRQWGVKKVYDAAGLIEATESEQTIDEVAMRAQMQALSESNEMMGSSNESPDDQHEQLSRTIQVVPIPLEQSSNVEGGAADDKDARNNADELTPDSDESPAPLANQPVRSAADEGTSTDTKGTEDSTATTTDSKGTNPALEAEAEKFPKQYSTEVSSIPSDSSAAEGNPRSGTKAPKKKKASKHRHSLADLLSPPKTTKFL